MPNSDVDKSRSIDNKDGRYTDGFASIPTSTTNQTFVSATRMFTYLPILGVAKASLKMRTTEVIQRDAFDAFMETLGCDLPTEENVRADLDKYGMTAGEASSESEPGTCVR